MSYDKWKTTEPDQEESFMPDEITDEREELYANIERLRLINAELLAAAKDAYPFVVLKDCTPGRKIVTRLQTAIAKAEKA